MNGPHVIEVSMVTFSFRGYIIAECSCGWSQETSGTDEFSMSDAERSAQNHLAGVR